MYRRRLGQTKLLGFTQYTFPRYRVGPHHNAICEKLEAVERGEISRLMVFCPPRHGKSELVSRRFPAWYVGRNPAKQIISASYGQDLASDFGRDVRNIVGSPEFGAIFPGTSLAADSMAKNRWHTNKNGMYIAAGVGTAITGRGADILNIDDPLKDREEADSQIIRDKVWNWYTSTAYTRLMPNGAVIVTLTRWHEDDLAGRLLNEMHNGGDQWEIVNFPAINAEGDALWPGQYNRAALDRIRAAVGERDWSALYQQNPVPTEGALFKVAFIAVMPAAPSGQNIVRAWDLAATKQSGTRDPDWTVGVKLLRTSIDHYVVLDVVRLRGGPDEVERAIIHTASQDGPSCRISIPQDPGQAGKTQVLYLTRKLSGYRVEATPESGDKATRAAPVATQANIGNLSIVQAPWNRPFLEELASFPSGSKDDQVDALSRAFSVIGVKPGFFRISSDAIAAMSSPL
jgi:predicted phage terminase large subunit-like protein